MKKTTLRFIIGFALFLLFSGVSLAHTPYLMVSDNEDGTADINGGYSNGQYAAGTLILLKSKETGEILWQGNLDEYGDLTVVKQERPYVIVFDGGPGHILEKDGPCPTKEEIEILESSEKTKKIQKKSTITSETEDDCKKSEILSVTPVTRIYPLQDDFEYVKDIFPEPLMVQDPNGVIRVIPIIQGYRYHHGKGLAKVMKRLEAKRKKGAKVDFKINDVPLCLGVTTGYLSLKFAIYELYGKDIPKADDFKIVATGEMCGGTRDMYSLYFGRQIGNQNITDFDREGITFIAERLSTGEKIVFGYNIRVFPELNKLILAKKNPERFKNVDFESLKRDITKRLFSMKDFSYFTMIE